MPSAVSAAAASKSTPQFTDAELSEIFQINFSEIFGSAADAAASSPMSTGYRGIQLPSPKATHRSRGQPPLSALFLAVFAVSCGCVPLVANRPRNLIFLSCNPPLPHVPPSMRPQTLVSPF